MTALLLVVKYWREAAIGALVLALIASCVARDHRIAATAVAHEKARVADSTIAVVAPKLAQADTLVVHDTVRVRVAVDRVVALHDTVLQHLTDTLLVREFVTRADSAAHACTELANDCAAFRAYATQKIAALETKSQVAQVITMRSCVEPAVVSGGIAGILGFIAADLTRRR